MQDAPFPDPKSSDEVSVVHMLLLPTVDLSLQICAAKSPNSVRLLLVLLFSLYDMQEPPVPAVKPIDEVSVVCGFLLLNVHVSALVRSENYLCNM